MTWVLALTAASVVLLSQFKSRCYAQQQTAENMISSAAPEACLSWFQWSNPYNADANSLNAVDRMMAEPDVNQFFTKLTDKLGVLPAILIPEGAPPAIKKAAATLGPHLVDAVMRKQGCVLVESFELNEDQEPKNIKAGVVLQVGKDVDQTMEAIDELLTTLGAPMERLEGGSVVKIQMPPNGPFEAAVIAKDGEFLLVATSPEMLGELQARMKAGKVADWLSELRSGASFVRTAAVGKIEIAKLKETFLPLVDQQAAKMINALGFDNLERLEFSGGYAKTDFEQRFALKFDGAPTGIFDAFGDHGLSVDDIAHFPEDSFFAVAMSLEGKRVLDQFQRTLIRINPSAAQEVAAGLIRFQSQSGIDVRGLIENLGPTFALHNGFGDGILSGAMLKANVSSVQDFEDTIKNVVDLLEFQTPDFQLAIDSIEQNGKTVNSLRFGGAPVPVEPSWVSGKEAVTISLFPSVLHSVTNPDLVPSLVKSKSFEPYAELLQTDSQVIGFAYSDTKLSYETFYGYGCMMAALGKNMLSESGLENSDLPLSPKQLAEIRVHLQELQLPSCRSVVRHLTPQVAVIRKEEDAIVLESHSSVASSNLTMFAPGVAIGMLLPAVQQVRGAARRTQSMNNLRQFALASLNFESAHMHFPSGDGPVKKGGPAVSWRVKILPFLEQGNLYEQYDFDQPWDSENNLKVLEQMPPAFHNPASNADPNHTVYRGAGGEGGVMGVDGEGKSRATTFGLISDGTSNTILFLEVPDTMAVPWTKPDGGIDPEKTTPQDLRGNHPGGFSAAFCDGSTNFISDSIADELFKNLMHMSDGGVVNDN